VKKRRSAAGKNAHIIKWKRRPGAVLSSKEKNVQKIRYLTRERGRESRSEGLKRLPRKRKPRSSKYKKVKERLKEVKEGTWAKLKNLWFRANR